MAPRLQPDVTAHDTAGEHLLAWGRSTARREQLPADEDAALPELNPWREAGWIFRDGGCVAIERRGNEPRLPGSLAD